MNVAVKCVIFASRVNKKCVNLTETSFTSAPFLLENHLSTTISEDDEEAYRRKMALDREKATSRKRKAISAEHAELARTTGLSGQVVALMAGHDDGDSDGDGSKSSNEDRRRRKKKKRKHRKEKSKKSKREKRSHDDGDDRSSDDSQEGKNGDCKNGHECNDKYDNDHSRRKIVKKSSRRADSDDSSIESSSSSSSTNSHKRKKKYRSKSKSKRSKKGGLH